MFRANAFKVCFKHMLVQHSTGAARSATPLETSCDKFWDNVDSQGHHDDFRIFFQGCLLQPGRSILCGSMVLGLQQLRSSLNQGPQETF